MPVGRPEFDPTPLARHGCTLSSRRVGGTEETERFEDRKIGRPAPQIIFLSLIFLSITEPWFQAGRPWTRVTEQRRSVCNVRIQIS